MELDLDAIDAAEKAMTDAPWAADSLWVTGGPYRLNLCSVRHKPDANGIAILRNAAPALTRRIREQDAEIARLSEVAKWAQATLTALNVGDVKSGCPLHLQLREVMIAYRAALKGEQ